MKSSLNLRLGLCILLFLGLLSCSSTGIENRGNGYYMVRCEGDVVNCFDMARMACESPFEVRTRYKDPHSELIETYIKCQ